MKCVICKNGETQEGFTTVTLEKNGSTVVFKEVPAQICDNCGEKYINSFITKELLKKARTIVKNGAEVDIRKYETAA
ncbi:MAG TPA: type II toxin-antitoxin system MqsA family antitoxin [Epsilonproteobacteria bacterium]|nr:type II toxin-antitoxin system MqsA family antitoxin [Campylobacterota bacterium]